MNIYQTLQKRLRAADNALLLKTLGYHNTKRGGETLSSFLGSPTLYDWLSTGRYDMKYSAEGFFLVACRHFGLSEVPCEEALEAAQAFADRVRKCERPYIYIDTGFKRTSQPIHVLALSEQLRRIVLKKEMILTQSVEETLGQIGALVRAHYAEYEGTLPLWGGIRRYVYHHTDGETFVFRPDGTIEEVPENVSESRATLTIGNKTLGGEL